MEIHDVTLKKKKEFPADVEVFIGDIELLDFRLAVTVLGRQVRSSQMTVIVQCLLDNYLS